MKNLLTTTLAFIITFTLIATISGCGNMRLLDTHWTFTEACIKTPDGWRLVKLKHWRDYEKSDTVQIETEDKVYLTHYSNVILIKDKSK